MVKFLIIIICFFNTRAFSSEHIIENLLANSADLQSNLDSNKDVNYIKSIFVVNSLKQSIPEIANTQGSIDSYKSYFKLPELIKINWDIQLNASRFQPDIWTSQEQDEKSKLKKLFQISKSSHLILNGGSKWSLYQSVPFRLLHTSQAPNNDANADFSNFLMDWLNQNLGYQGIILKRVKHYLLIVADEQLLSFEGTKGIVIKNSKKAGKIQISRAEGSALLRLIKSKEQYGVFEILKAEKDLKIEPGDKVVLESHVN
ncbi:MAG: hypothetical protein KBD78_03145 [Oligoflexales bacterium]|nr:hypothetical protein [Oligoflexales bacterium]